MTSPADAPSAHLGRKLLTCNVAAREWDTYPLAYPQINLAGKA